jgi:hypothetical protein
MIGMRSMADIGQLGRQAGDKQVRRWDIKLGAYTRLSLIALYAGEEGAWQCPMDALQAGTGALTAFCPTKKPASEPSSQLRLSRAGAPKTTFPNLHMHARAEQSRMR